MLLKIIYSPLLSDSRNYCCWNILLSSILVYPTQKILAQEIDVDGDGEVSEQEFNNFMTPIIVKEESVAEPEASARRMFNIIDSMEESDGKVTTKKFKDMLELFGMPMSYEEVRELFHEYDEDFDGYLDEEEFTLMMMDTGIED